MDNICKTVHEKNTDMGNKEYYTVVNAVGSLILLDILKLYG